MPANDARYEELQAVLPRTLLIGLFLLPGLDAPSSTDCPVQVTPGLAVIDGHAGQLVGDDDLDLESGTLTDGYEKWHSVVAYYNPLVNGIFLLTVSGAEVLIATGASQPTDAEIAAAIVAIVGAGVEYSYTVVGAALFRRSTTVTLISIDHQVRSFEIPTDRKDLAAAYNFVAISEAAVYRPHSTMYLGSVDAADIADGDIVTAFPLPPMYGRVSKIRAVCEKAITTGAKLSNLNAEIGTTNLTGGVVALAGAYALGAVQEGTAITAANTFVPGDTIAIEASSTTTFIEGRVGIYVEIDELQLSP